jgi:pyridoxal phosphate enzyme (YggS family)
MTQINENLIKVRQRIAEACARSKRREDDVRLIGVSKTLPTETILQAYDAGLRCFGENRPQELRDKITLLPQDIEWHFIGHLQKNKIKYVAGKATLIHSVDSRELAGQLSQYAVKQDLELKILLEVNTSSESSKFGVTPQEAAEVFMAVRQLPNLRLQGLMTIGPFVEEVQTIRRSFRTLRTIKEDLASQVTPEEIIHLSMGMSHDYEIAIEEGSTMVRIGTAIFGPRGR